MNDKGSGPTLSVVSVFLKLKTILLHSKVFHVFCIVFKMIPLFITEREREREREIEGEGGGVTFCLA